MKQLWKIIKSLNLTQIRSLFMMFIKNPLLIFPTVRATLICLKIVNEKFPKLHHLHNPANAYRHALWNALIAFRILKQIRTTDKALEWTQRITDWHEEFAPNEPLAKAMDLHNNKIGRMVFIQLKKEEKEITRKIIIETLYKYLKNAKKISSVSEIKEYESQLVYIND